MKDKITFKKQPRETGLAGISRPEQSVDIKLNGKVIGIISAPTAFDRDWVWKIKFTVFKKEPDDNPNCDWKWIAMKQTYETVEEARIATQDAIRIVQNHGYKFYTGENQ